jgi:hypothetical protein
MTGIDRVRRRRRKLMTVIVWLLEFAICWLICVLVITRVDPLVTKVSSWIDSRLLKRVTTGTLLVKPVENRIDEARPRR